MWPFQRRKNVAETHPAFQGAAENWLRRPRDADPDAVVLQACFFRMTPFRRMLLTLQSGLQR